MTLQPILPASCTTGRRVPAQPHDRLDRLAAIDAEHKEMALLFLSGYAPHVFDDVLDAAEPITDYSLGDDAEPYCITCGASAGVFPTLGDGWRHYCGDGITAKAQPYDAGHPAIIGWRTAAATEDNNASR
jgi:hypothetical protein